MSDDSPHEPGARRAWRTDAEWRRLRLRIDVAEHADARRQVPRWRPYALAAAAVLVAIALAWQYQRSDTPAIQVASTAAGERETIRLPDGSVITLGPASTIRYRVGPSRDDLELDGLAHFAVTHDDTRPFVVRARNAVTTDIGTEFAIRAYDTDTAVQVTVTSGAVSLAGAPSSAPVELRAGTVGLVGAAGVAVRDSSARAATGLAWMEGRLAFDNRSFASVAAELSRWFDVDVRIEGDTLARRRVSAMYASPTLAGVLDALSETVGARYERTGRVIVFRPRVR